MSESCSSRRGGWSCSDSSKIWCLGCESLDISLISLHAWIVPQHMRLAHSAPRMYNALREMRGLQYVLGGQAICAC